jgi:hypothetical protein
MGPRARPGGSGCLSSRTARFDYWPSRSGVAASTVRYRLHLGHKSTWTATDSTRQVGAHVMACCCLQRVLLANGHPRNLFLALGYRRHMSVAGGSDGGMISRAHDTTRHDTTPEHTLARAPPSRVPHLQHVHRLHHTACDALGLTASSRRGCSWGALLNTPLGGAP